MHVQVRIGQHWFWKRVAAPEKRRSSDGDSSVGSSSDAAKSNTSAASAGRV